MPVHDYVIRMVMSECNLSSEKLNALVELADDIGDLLPYLNTVLSLGDYSHPEKIFTVKRGGHLITFRPRQIAITKLDDEDEAKKVAEDLIHIINETDARRDEIIPMVISKRRVNAIDLFKLLPGKNCGECGEATCLAFAMKLAGGETACGACPQLEKEEFAASRIRLKALLGDNTSS